MRGLTVIALLSMMGLTACLENNDVANTIARDQAKGVVNGVVSNRFPGVNAAPVTDCIIDAANANEILSIAGAAVTGVNENTVNQVLGIAKRPDAVNCIASNSISLLGG